MKISKRLIFTVVILLAIVGGWIAVLHQRPKEPAPAPKEKAQTVATFKEEKKSGTRQPASAPVVPDMGKNDQPEDHDKKIIALYQKKYTEIMNQLKRMDFDFEEMSVELRRRLKASENGKLERREILELLPPEVAEEYGEMLDLLSELQGEKVSRE